MWDILVSLVVACIDSCRLLARDTLTIEGAVFEHGQCADGALEFSAVLEPSLKRFPLERCERTPGLYVSEVNNHRVTRWDLEGGGRIVVGGFGRGSGLGQLAGPKGLCFDEHGVCYVAEAGNRRVTRWCPREGRGALAGGGQTVVGDGGECDRGGELEEPGGICLGHSGELYVADVRGHAVSCWNQEPVAVAREMAWISWTARWTWPSTRRVSWLRPLSDFGR